METSIADTIELILTIVVSIIGAGIHEYIFKEEELKRLLKHPRLWISVFVSSIISYSINPWVANINPRLVLLPPLLLGLAGMDLVIRLTTLKGVTILIEYVLGFFGVSNDNKKNIGVPKPKQEDIRLSEAKVEKEADVEKDEDEKDSSSDDDEEEEKPKKKKKKRKKDEDYADDTETISESNVTSSSTNIPNVPSQQPIIPTPHDMLYYMVTPTGKFEKIENLDDMVTSVMDSICNLIVGYYSNHDKELFLKGYFIIQNNKAIMNHNVSKYQLIHVETALRMSEILKKEIELNQVYNDIVNSSKAERND